MLRGKGRPLSGKLDARPGTTGMRQGPIFKCKSPKRLHPFPSRHSRNFAAAVGDAREFKNGRHFAARVRLVRRQYSLGGKSKLYGISRG